MELEIGQWSPWSHLLHRISKDLILSHPIYLFEVWCLEALIVQLKSQQQYELKVFSFGDHACSSFPTSFTGRWNGIASEMPHPKWNGWYYLLTKDSFLVIDLSVPLYLSVDRSVTIPVTAFEKWRRYWKHRVKTLLLLSITKKMVSKQLKLLLLSSIVYIVYNERI